MIFFNVVMCQENQLETSWGERCKCGIVFSHFLLIVPVSMDLKFNFEIEQVANLPIRRNQATIKSKVVIE